MLLNFLILIKIFCSVLLPGGATYFNQSHGYADAGRHIYEIAMEVNNNGTYFPIWGTCLGFELLVYLSANSTEPRTYCSSSSQALPLEFKDSKFRSFERKFRKFVFFCLFIDFNKSRLFRNASENIINILKNYAVTSNFHLYCFTEEVSMNVHPTTITVRYLGHFEVIGCAVNTQVISHRNS